MTHKQAASAIVGTAMCTTTPTIPRPLSAQQPSTASVTLAYHVTRDITRMVRPALHAPLDITLLQVMPAARSVLPAIIKRHLLQQAVRVAR